ncbi:hypothetical protein Zmor_013927 [Zophobas morio]|uniref:Cytochrome P450 n=2 Tax=Zophobas morio TaxID=2755281 RepID=A0AA38MG05_9CUCU|nr:hypothetical protein Zmor_013927 [Zophobas morio]
MVVVYLIVATFLILYWYFTRNFNHWKNKNVPFLKPLPFFGNVIDGIFMRQAFGEMFSTLYQKSKEPVLGFFILDKPCLLLRDPEVIKRILITDFQYFFDRNVLNNKRDDPIGTHMLFFLKNPDWKEMRTKITPVFTSSKMKAMSNLIENSSNELTNYLSTQVERKSVIEMKEVCLKFTVNVITSTAFGVDSNSFKDDSRFCEEAKRMINWDDFMTAFRIRCYFLAHSVVKIFRLKLFNPISIKFLEESFWDIMNSRTNSKSHRNDLIDILLQLKRDEKNFLDGDLLTSQAVIFFAAGFETSSSTMGFALHELACQPEIQTKLRKEIIEISKQHGGINYDSLKKMEYLEMCVKETLRKYPVLPALERKSNSRYTIPETGTVIEKDTPVFISVMGLQNDPKYFPNPEVFDPERFSSNNKHLVENCSYLPFGEGPRNCIGARFGMMSVKFGLANIIKNFVVEATSETKQKIKLNPNGLVLSPQNGISLKVTRV